MEQGWLVTSVVCLSLRFLLDSFLKISYSKERPVINNNIGRTVKLGLGHPNTVQSNIQPSSTCWPTVYCIPLKPNIVPWDISQSSRVSDPKYTEMENFAEFAHFTKPLTEKQPTSGDATIRSWGLYYYYGYQYHNYNLDLCSKNIFFWYLFLFVWFL